RAGLQRQALFILARAAAPVPATRPAAVPPSTDRSPPTSGRTTMYIDLKDQLTAVLAESEQAGTFKHERVISTAQGGRVTAGPVGRAGSEVLNLCANDYFGLADDARLLEAAKRALDERVFGTASVPFTSGTQHPHLQLERAVSEFLGTEDTILFSSCFVASGAVFEPLFGPEDAIISDALNHASLIDGIRLSKAARFRYRNADL